MEKLEMNKTIKIAIFTIILTMTANTVFTQTPTTAEGFYTLGRQQFSEKNFDGAIKSFSECVKLNANAQPCIYARGAAYFENKQYDLSAVDFSKLLSNSALQPREKMQALNGRLQAYCLSGKITEATADENAVKALGGNIQKTCVQFLAENPNLRPGVMSPEEYIKRGDDLAKKDGKHQEAISNYEKALSKKNSSTDNKKDSNIYLKIADAYSSLGDEVKTLSNIMRAISLDPNNADAYVKRGEINYRKKDFVSAEADFNKAISVNPQLDMAYLRRGQLYALKKKDNNRAIKDFEKIFEVTNSQITASVAFSSLLNLYYADKNDEGIISTYTKYIKSLESIRPDLIPDKLVGRAEIYLRVKNLDKAAADLNAAEKAFSSAKYVSETDKLGLYLTQAKLNMARKDYPSAIASLTKSEQFINSLDPNVLMSLRLLDSSSVNKIPIYISRANAYCLSGKKSEAKADEQKAIALGGKVENPCK